MSHEAAYVLAASEKGDLMRLSSPVRMALSQSSNCRSYMSLLRSSSNCRAGVEGPHHRRQLRGIFDLLAGAAWQADRIPVIAAEAGGIPMQAWLQCSRCRQPAALACCRTLLLICLLAR